MGLRFRKSFKIGPARINLSKSGIGWSVGSKHLRYTRKATGGSRVTTSVPGTGLSYAKDFSGNSEIDSKHYAAGKTYHPTGENNYKPSSYRSKTKKKSNGCLPVFLITIFSFAFILLISTVINSLFPNTENKNAISTDVIPSGAVWDLDAEIQFETYPGSVSPGDTVSTKISGCPNVDYSIVVYVGSERIDDNSLISTTSDFSGCATWSWDIPETAQPGIYYIEVSDRLGNKNCIDYAILNSMGEVVGKPPSREPTSAESDQGTSFNIEIETVSTPESSSDVVYITSSGTKYHRSSCQHLSNSKSSIDVNTAISKGYTACSVCNP